MIVYIYKKASKLYFMYGNVTEHTFSILVYGKYYNRDCRWAILPEGAWEILFWIKRDELYVIAKLHSWPELGHRKSATTPDLFPSDVHFPGRI